MAATAVDVVACHQLQRVGDAVALCGRWLSSRSDAYPCRDERSSGATVVQAIAQLLDAVSRAVVAAAVVWAVFQCAPTCRSLPPPAAADASSCSVGVAQWQVRVLCTARYHNHPGSSSVQARCSQQPNAYSTHPQAVVRCCGDDGVTCVTGGCSTHHASQCAPTRSLSSSSLPPPAAVVRHANFPDPRTRTHGATGPNCPQTAVTGCSGGCVVLL